MLFLLTEWFMLQLGTGDFPWLHSNSAFDSHFKYSEWFTEKQFHDLQDRTVPFSQTGRMCPFPLRLYRYWPSSGKIWKKKEFTYWWIQKQKYISLLQFEIQSKNQLARPRIDFFLVFHVSVHSVENRLILADVEDCMWVIPDALC